MNCNLDQRRERKRGKIQTKLMLTTVKTFECVICLIFYYDSMQNYNMIGLIISLD